MKKINFEGVLSELEAKICFQRLSAKFFVFLSLSTALIVKNSHILAGIYLSKKCPRPNLKLFNTKFGPQWKDREKVIKLNKF